MHAKIKWFLGHSALACVVTCMFFMLFAVMVLAFSLLLIYILYRIVRFRKNWRPVGTTLLEWDKTQHNGGQE